MLRPTLAPIEQLPSYTARIVPIEGIMAAQLTESTLK